MQSIKAVHPDHPSPVRDVSDRVEVISRGQPGIRIDLAVASATCRCAATCSLYQIMDMLMAGHTFDADVSLYQEAAEMAVFRLYGFLGAGARLIKALESLSGVQKFVASPYRDRMDIFRVSVLAHQIDEPVHLEVVHAPDYESVSVLCSLPGEAPGYWTAVLKAVRVDGPFTLQSLTVEGRALALHTTQSQDDSSAR